MTTSTLQLQTPITIRVRNVKKYAKAIYKLKIKLKEKLTYPNAFFKPFFTGTFSSFMAMDYVDICTLGDWVDNAQSNNGIKYTRVHLIRKKVTTTIQTRMNKSSYKHHWHTLHSYRLRHQSEQKKLVLSKLREWTCKCNVIHNSSSKLN